MVYKQKQYSKQKSVIKLEQTESCLLQINDIYVEKYFKFFICTYNREKKIRQRKFVLNLWRPSSSDILEDSGVGYGPKQGPNCPKI